MARSRMSHLIMLLALAFVSTIADEICKDLYPKNCKKWQKSGYCHVEMFKPILQNKCRKSCNFCTATKCVDLVEESRCLEWLDMGLCGIGKVSAMCGRTCETCNPQIYCPRLSIKNGKFVSGTNEQFKNANLKIDTSGVIPSGTEVRVACARGYQLMGSDFVTCLETGEYDGVLGVCVRHGLCDVPTYSSRSNIYFLLAESMSVDNTLSKVSPGTFGVLLCMANNRKLETFCSSYGTWLPEIRDCNDDTVHWEVMREEDDNTVEYRN